MVNEDHKPFLIRGYRRSDREAVRKLCCDTGFLGDPIDPVYEDRELFADFLTTYYTDHEPGSCFLLEVDGEIRGYLLGSRKPLQNQLYALYQNVWLFFRALTRYFRYNRTLAPFCSVDPGARMAGSASGAATHTAFSYQSPAGCPKSFHDAGPDERVFKLSLSLRRKTGLRPDHYIRKPAW